MTPTWIRTTTRMFRGLRHFVRTGILLREIKGIHTELQRIATALEALQPPVTQWVPVPAEESVEVAYVDDSMQAELVEIETRLTVAVGRPPTEEQVMAEYERLHDLTPGTFGGRVS